MRSSHRDLPSRVAAGRALGQALLDWVLPRVCAGCGARPPAALALCASCRTRVPWLLEEPPRSGAAIEIVVAAAAYRDPVETWLRRFKYPGTSLGALHPGPEAIARELIRSAAEHYAERAPAPIDAIIAIPSPAERIRERGFHPAAVLAKEVAGALGRPTLRDALRAAVLRPSQTGLNRSERQRNVDAAFRANPKAALRGARVLVVDDIVTTGATLQSAASVLRKAGACRVDAVCAAHAQATPP